MSYETKPNNPAAFPNYYTDGMTLMDYFAAKALQGYCADSGYPPHTSAEVAAQSYADAVAMLKGAGEAFMILLSQHLTCRVCGNPTAYRTENVCRTCEFLDFTAGESAHEERHTDATDGRPPEQPPLPARSETLHDGSPVTSRLGNSRAGTTSLRLRIDMDMAEQIEVFVAARNRLLELMARFVLFRKTEGYSQAAITTLAAAKALGAFYRRTFIERRYEIV